MTIEFPSSAVYTPNRSDFGLITNTQIHTSPLNQATQTLELPGGRWTATLEWNYLTKLERRTLTALFLSLGGRDGRLELWDHSHPEPDGAYDSGSDTPVVAGADQTGTSLDTSGWRNNGTGLLLPGDYFGLTISSQKRLFMVIESVDSDGSGLATISIRPQLPASPADSAALVLVRPPAEFMLASDEETKWRNQQLFSDMSISLVEAF